MLYSFFQMKQLLVLLLMASFYTACAPTTTKSLTVTPESESGEEYSAQADLVAKIEAIPGLRIDGFGHNMKVSSCPNFILNGIERGNNLFDICQLVEGKKIEKVEFPRNSGPTIYRNGLLGSLHSFIVIETD